MVTITRGARNILLGTLQGNEWYDSPKLAYLAGEMLTKVFPESEETPANMKQEEVMKWLCEELTYELTEQQKKTCAVCIKFYLDKKALNPNRFLFELMGILGMEPED